MCKGPNNDLQRQAMHSGAAPLLRCGERSIHIVFLQCMLQERRAVLNVTSWTRQTSKFRATQPSEPWLSGRLSDSDAKRCYVVTGPLWWVRQLCWMCPISLVKVYWLWSGCDRGSGAFFSFHCKVWRGTSVSSEECSKQDSDSEKCSIFIVERLSLTSFFLSILEIKWERRHPKSLMASPGFVWRENDTRNCSVSYVFTLPKFTIIDCTGSWNY